MQPSHRALAAAVVPDHGDGGSGVGQSLISQELMAIILILGMSREFLTLPMAKFMVGLRADTDFSLSSGLVNGGLVIYDIPCRVQGGFCARLSAQRIDEFERCSCRL